MYYYNNQTPEEIAEAIKSVDLNDNYNGREIIAGLDKQFIESIKRIL